MKSYFLFLSTLTLSQICWSFWWDLWCQQQLSESHYLIIFQNTLFIPSLIFCAYIWKVNYSILDELAFKCCLSLQNLESIPKFDLLNLTFFSIFFWIKAKTIWSLKPFYFYRNSNTFQGLTAKRFNYWKNLIIKRKKKRKTRTHSLHPLYMDFLHEVHFTN